MAPRFTCNSVNQTRYFFALMLFFSFFCTAQQSETIEQKALRNVQENIDTLYLDLLFNQENRQFLKTQMFYMGDIFEKEKLGLELFQPYSPDRRNALVRLVLSSFTAREQDSPNAGFYSHILEAHRQQVREPEDITKWYQARGMVFNGLTANDWNQSLTELVEKAVDSSLLRYPETLIEENHELAVQLAFILLQTHELYWRGRGMRLLGYKVDQLSSTHGNTPGFHLFLQHLTNRFQNKPTLWHSFQKTQLHQKQLANVFTHITTDFYLDFSRNYFPYLLAASAAIVSMILIEVKEYFSFIASTEEKQETEEPKHKAKANAPDRKQPGIDDRRSPEKSSGASWTNGNEMLGITCNNRLSDDLLLLYQASPYDHSTVSSFEPSSDTCSSSNWCSSAPSSDEVYNRDATFT